MLGDGTGNVKLYDLKANKVLRQDCFRVAPVHYILQSKEWIVVVYEDVAIKIQTALESKPFEMTSAKKIHCPAVEGSSLFYGSLTQGVQKKFIFKQPLTETTKPSKLDLKYELLGLASLGDE